MLLGLAVGWGLGRWAGGVKATLMIYCVPTFSRVDHWQSSQDWLEEHLHSPDLPTRLAVQLEGKPALQEIAYSLALQVEEKEPGVLRVSLTARNPTLALALVEAVWKMVERASADPEPASKHPDAELIDSQEKLNYEDRQLVKWLWEFTGKEERTGATGAARAAGLRFESYQKAYEAWLRYDSEKRASRLREASSRPLLVLVSGPEVRREPVGWAWPLGGLALGWMLGGLIRPIRQTSCEP